MVFSYSRTIFGSGCYGLLIARNTDTAVNEEYQPPFAFTGKLDKVTIEMK
jgi:hypothetical protein